MLSQPTGYISWDLDGVLWDSDLAHYLAVNEALKHYGTHITEEEHLSIFKGLPTLRKCEMLTQMGRIPPTAHQDISRRKQAATIQAIERTVKPRPEVDSLLLGLQECGWRQCCCSNSIRETVMRVLLGMGISHYFDFYLSNEDVVKGKPAPDMFLKAASIYHINSAQLVAIEDAKAGRQAVLSAGCQLIAIDGPQDIKPSLMHRIITIGWEMDRKKHFDSLPCAYVGAI